MMYDPYGVIIHEYAAYVKSGRIFLSCVYAIFDVFTLVGAYICRKSGYTDFPPENGG